MQLVAGSRLGTCEIVAPLGAGEWAKCTGARDPALKREVAIKVLPEDWSADPARLQRFEVEAQATAALNLLTLSRSSMSAGTMAVRTS